MWIKIIKESLIVSESFVSEWEKKNSVPLSRKITEKIHSIPLKDRISKATFSLNVVQKRIDNSRFKMEQKYNDLFNKCVNAQQAKDTNSSIMYANECAQVKEMTQTVLSTGLALEQVTLRLETVKDLGDVAVAVMPATAIIQTLKGRLSGILPELSMQLGGIGHTLDSIVLEAGQAIGSTWSSLPIGEDAENILAEANAIAEQKMREKFPQLPTADLAERGVNP